MNNLIIHGISLIIIASKRKNRSMLFAPVKIIEHKTKNERIMYGFTILYITNMKNKGKFMTVFIVNICLLPGCYENNLYENISNVQTEYNTTNNSDVIETISYGLSFDSEDILLSEEQVKLTPALLVDEGVADVGIFIFIDGMLRQYSLENSTDKSTMLIFDLIPQSTITHDLFVDALLDSNSNHHFISIMSILMPNYVPESNSPNLGNYHRGISPYSVEITDIDDSNCISQGVVDSLSVKSFTVSDEQLNLYGYKDMSDSVITDIRLYQNIYTNNKNYYEINSNHQTVNLTFVGYSNETGSKDYRVTFFKNHEPIMVNEKFCCIDITIGDNKIVETEVKINDVNSGDFLYCIAVPLEQGAAAIKSQSMMTVNNGNL